MSTSLKLGGAYFYGASGTSKRVGEGECGRGVHTPFSVASIRRAYDWLTLRCCAYGHAFGESSLVRRIEQLSTVYVESRCRDSQSVSELRSIS